MIATQSLVDQITDRHGLVRTSEWSDVGGSWTTNLRLGSLGRGDLGLGGDLLARVHPSSTTADRVLAEQAVRGVLAAAGLPTVVPITDDHGETVLIVNGSVVEVEPFVTWTERMNTADRLEQGAALLARVHDVLRTAELPAAAYTVEQANHIAAADAVAATSAGAVRLRRSGAPELAAFADEIEAHVAAVAAAEAAYAEEQVVQVVHGDFWDNNVLFGPRGDVVALIDFGFMAQRPRIDDLALTVWFWLLQPGAGLPGPAAMATVARWLDAYDAHTDRPLSAAERASLPLAVARQPAWSVGGWVLHNDEADAYRHARECVAEQPVAAAVLRDLDRWQQALTARPTTLQN